MLLTYLVHAVERFGNGFGVGSGGCLRFCVFWVSVLTAKENRAKHRSQVRQVKSASH